MDVDGAGEAAPPFPDGAGALGGQLSPSFRRGHRLEPVSFLKVKLLRDRRVCFARPLPCSHRSQGSFDQCVLLLRAAGVEGRGSIRVGRDVPLDGGEAQAAQARLLVHEAHKGTEKGGEFSSPGVPAECPAATWVQDLALREARDSWRYASTRPVSDAPLSPVATSATAPGSCV